MYEYEITEVIEVHDGDTCTVEIDLGMHVHLRPVVIRLAHINAPELHEANGEAAQKRLAQLLTQFPLIVNTTRDRTEKYGRWLGAITNGSGIDVGKQLLVEKLAVSYEGGRR